MSRIEREVLVNAPADSVYQVWRNFENLPNFMSEVDEVREEPRGVTHWRRKRTLGSDVEWEAEVTIDEPSHAIGWRTVGQGDDGAEALVEFESLGDATRVRYCVDHRDPAGVGAIASLFSSEEHHIEDDLKRFKEIVESSGYMRATERIANVNTSDEEERRVRERYPADSYPPADGAPKQNRRTIQEFSQTEGTWAQHARVGAAPNAPGNANDQQEGRPVRKPGTNPSYAEAKDRALGSQTQPEEDQTAYEDGEPDLDNSDRPMDTGTPGGMLGTASHDELTGDPEAESSKMDERLEADER